MRLLDRPWAVLRRADGENHGGNDQYGQSDVVDQRDGVCLR